MRLNDDDDDDDDDKKSVIHRGDVVQGTELFGTSVVKST